MLACRPADRMTEEQLSLYNELLKNCPMLGLMRVLAEEFRGALFGGDASKMRDWIHTAIQSGYRSTDPIRLWSSQGPTSGECRD
jgi:hypothetical protein